MTLETTGAKTVTSPLVLCLIFSRTCTAKPIERFVYLTLLLHFTAVSKISLSAERKLKTLCLICRNFPEHIFVWRKFNIHAWTLLYAFAPLHLI